MKIIISPAKRMKTRIEYMEAETIPMYLQKTKQLLNHLKTRKVEELQRMLKCNENIARWAYQSYQNMELSSSIVPALLAFDGIQYSYMKPDIFLDDYFDYVRKHLFILSGFYGILRAMDGVVAYRLELDNTFQTPFCNSLYDFWKDDLYQAIVKEDHDILDLSSKQYGKIVKKYQTKNVRIVSCYFCEIEGNRLLEKGVYVKMARGEMVRYLAEINAQSFEEVKGFCYLGYQFDEEASDESSYIFVRSKENRRKYAKKCN